MTIDQVKAEAKKRFGQDLTDEQARAWLEKQAEELTDEELETVAGGPFITPLIHFPKEKLDEK